MSQLFVIGAKLADQAISCDPNGTAKISCHGEPTRLMDQQRRGIIAANTGLMIQLAIETQWPLPSSHKRTPLHNFTLLSHTQMGSNSAAVRPS